METDDLILARQKEEITKETETKVMIELVKVEAKNIVSPIQKDKYNFVFFTQHNYIVIHKIEQFANAESIMLPICVILVSEITSVEIIEEKKILLLITDNKGVYNIYFRRLDKCESIKQIISNKLNIMQDYYDVPRDRKKNWAKYYTAAYFESLYDVDNNYETKHKSLLNDDVFEYFSEAIANEANNVLERKLWFGKCKKYERTFKLENLKDLLKEIKGKNLVDREVLAVLATHKQLVNYYDEPFENYLKLYYDILDNEFLPKWMDTNSLYTFKIDKLIKDETNSKTNPFYEFISLLYANKEGQRYATGGRHALPSAFVLQKEVLFIYFRNGTRSLRFLQFYKSCSIMF